MLPHFFVVGAQKAASTSLHRYLRQHPDIYLPVQKESKFFVMDQFYERGLDYYEQEYFSLWKEEKAVGEVDPDIMFFEHAQDRMARHLDISACRFIFIFRNPVERAFSHYLMTYRRGLENLSFEDAIAEEPKRMHGGFDAQLHYSYTSRGYYLRQVERFLSRVDRKQTYYLLTDDLLQDPVGALRRLFSFLDVEPSFIPSRLERRYHKATVFRNRRLTRLIMGPSIFKNIFQKSLPNQKIRNRIYRMLLSASLTSRHGIIMGEETREALFELYRGENRRLEHFLGRSLDIWRGNPRCKS
ncbi:sulfotransferase [Candidatus Moduliflexota bacterium]